MVRFGIILAALVAAATISAEAADNSLSAAANAAYLAANAKKPGVVVRPSGLQYRIIHNGFGKRPGPTDYVTVYYTGIADQRSRLRRHRARHAGTLQSQPTGQRLDRSADARCGSAIIGKSCCRPNSAMAKRERRMAPIPPNQTLVFDLELIKAVPAKMRPHKPDEDPDKIDDNADMGPDDEAQ